MKLSLESFTELQRRIEALPAGEQQTNLSIFASEVRTGLQNGIDKMDKDHQAASAMASSLTVKMGELQTAHEATKQDADKFAAQRDDARFALDAEKAAHAQTKIDLQKAVASVPPPVKIVRPAGKWKDGRFMQS